MEGQINIKVSLGVGDEVGGGDGGWSRVEWRTLSRDSNLSTLDRDLCGRVCRTDQVLTLDFWI